MACVVKTALLSFAAVRGFPRAFTTNGRRTSWTVEVNAIGSREPRQGKKRLAGDTARAATPDEVKDLRREARDLKEGVAEQTLELRLLKKSMVGPSRDIAAQCPSGQWMGAIKNEISVTRQSLLAAMKGLHPRSWRSSGWLKKVICQRVVHWSSWVSLAPHSTVGTTDTCNAAKLACKIDLPNQSTFGTAFPTR
ncbi:hypothetical protein CLV88_1451 [Shimia abyssi]|uniref:Uncharacterized protein n=1 Tax=Shimia abyssi TaxID=1662395 RepID=A0A2P8ERP1_9RHOB|nr:hypothetical protein CLV88_1451 [Shimia abyssi]